MAISDHSDVEALEEVKQAEAVQTEVAPQPLDSLSLQDFFDSLNKLSQVDEKLKACLAFMKDAISQEGTPRLREFWDVKNHAIGLFKEKMHAGARAILWQEYRDLSDEAKRVKDILDNNAAFAIEQITLALKAISDELKAVEDGHMDYTFSLDLPCAFIEQRMDRYQSLQKALHYYNAFALRVNSLRKELVKTDMRVRNKNALFKELSSLGDRVFPKRKELISAISLVFSEDVSTFIDESFSGNALKAPFYVLREEIKGIQSFAKKLTLDTKAFAETRKQLSSCWDKVREVERERKKARIQKKEAFQHNLDEILSKFKTIQSTFEKSEITTEQALDQLDAILKDRDTELGRDEKKVIRKQHAEIAKVVKEKQATERDERAHKEKKRIEESEQAYQSQKETLFQLTTAEPFNPETSGKAIEEAKASIKKLSLQGVQKRELNQLIRALADKVNDHNEQMIIENVQDGEGLTKLVSVLEQKEERRKEIKQQLEVYRKEAGNSGMDFAQAMTYQELMASEKSKLESIDQAIVDLRQKIKALKAGSSA